MRVINILNEQITQTTVIYFCLFVKYPQTHVCIHSPGKSSKEKGLNAHVGQVYDLFHGWMSMNLFSQ